MRKLFVSQMFHGRTEEEIFEERAQIVEKIEHLFEEKFEVIDQYHQSKPEGSGKFYYLSQDILMIENADIVVFAPNWHEASGCRVEHELCLVYGINAFELGDLNAESTIIRSIRPFQF